MRYIVIIYYVLIEGEQIFETLNVNKNIEANSPEEAIGIAYNLFKAEAPDERLYFLLVCCCRISVFLLNRLQRM